jgi:hypothetical protein
VNLEVKWDKSGIAPLQTKELKRALVKALRKAGMTALRDMRSEASKRIRARKRLAPKYITRALTMARPRGSDIASFEWALKVSGKPVPLIAYPHKAVGGRAATRSGRGKAGPRSQGGVIVEVNPGKRTLIRGAFVQTMASGHQGIFKRRGRGRLPIDELLGSRPVDALLHQGEADAVAERGGRSFADTFARVLPMEIASK